jgi:prolyl 4-hydroxylase
MENKNLVKEIMGINPKSDFNLQEIPGFISFDEAAEFVKLIDKSNKIDSTIGVNGQEVKNDTRISQTVGLCDCTKIVINLKKKVAKYLDVPLDNIEPVQGQVYGVGGKFNVHQDGFDTKNLTKFGLASGNRTKTLMVYLNYDMEGGSTSFPNVNQQFMPFTGTALTWDNLNDKEEPDIRAKHSGDEVVFGKKYILTFWIRENKWDGAEDNRLYQQYIAEQQGLPPKYSNAEYHVLSTPSEVTNMLTTVMMAEKDNGKQETGINEIDGISKLYSLDDYPEVRDRIHEIYLPIAELLSGQKLEPTFVYGLRKYKKGAVLKAHRDRIDTHQVSFSITYFNDEPWPIDLELENGKMYPINLEAGKSLYYEGARQKHGRITPYEGSSYINLYVHYKVAEQPKIKRKSHVKMI